MEDDITVGVQLLLEDGVSEALATIMKVLAAADQAIAATSANWEGLHLGDGARLSPSPPPPDDHVTKPLQSPAPESDAPNLSRSHRDPQEFAAPLVMPTRPGPPMRSDGVVPGLEAPPPSYAPVQPDVPAPGETWSEPAPKLDGFGFDLTSMRSALPSAPMDIGDPRPATSPIVASISPDFSMASAAPIPTDDRSIVAPQTPQMSDPSWQAQPPSTFAPILPLQAQSMAPREIESAATVPAAIDLAPSGGRDSDAIATAPFAETFGGEGQLMLDGSPLGRWIIDHLSREADRPSAGGTAFDPRQSR